MTAVPAAADDLFGQLEPVEAASDELFPGDWNNDNLDTFAVRRIVS